MDMMKLRLTIEIASRCLNQLEAALDRNDHSAAETALRRVDRELDTLIAGLSLKFFGLSEIRSHSPYFQAKLEASRPMQGVMSYFESRNYALGGRPVTAKVLVS